MNQVRLTRIETSSEHGTFGVLTINGEVFCVTLEPYWRDNTSGVSSIPTGQYICKPFKSPKFGDVYMVMDVQGRSMVEFHKGNVDRHTRGCILLGQYFGKLSSTERAVLNSGNTFKSFMSKMDDKEFNLTIVDSY